MPYAGTTSILSFNHSISNDTVKELKPRSQSAGNIFSFLLKKKLEKNNKNETSETLRNETVKQTENVKPISIHVPRHIKPINDEQFGHYLAGYIESAGEFNSKQELIIVSLEPTLAYFLKEKIGYGSVKKVSHIHTPLPSIHYPHATPPSSILPPHAPYLYECKHNKVDKRQEGRSMDCGKDKYILKISSQKGLIRVINLINGKFRTENKYEEILKNILNQSSYEDFRKKIDFKLNLNPKELKNHWLAGFSDANARFKIKILLPGPFSTPSIPLNYMKGRDQGWLDMEGNSKYNCENTVEVKLNFEIENTNKNVLLLIKNFLGGNIIYRKSKDTYNYETANYGSAKNVINYLDQYHLISSKHVDYLKWRKAYLIIKNKNLSSSFFSSSLAHDGQGKDIIDKLIKFKNTIKTTV